MSGGRMRDMWPDVHPAVKGLRIAGMVVLGIVGAGVFALVFGWLVMILWNWLMPAVFRLGEITYWQAFGLVILAKLIFGGFGKPHHGGPGRKPWRPGPHGLDRGYDGWRLYREFWESEGKQAFEQFRQRKTAESGSTGESRPAGA